MVWQREFFKLAAVYLSARQAVMGGHGDMAYHVLGMKDYAFEMRLVLKSRSGNTSETEPTLEPKP